MGTELRVTVLIYTASTYPHAATDPQYTLCAPHPQPIITRATEPLSSRCSGLIPAEKQPLPLSVEARGPR
ncbi:hypothetical protein PBY51_011252 [Eleginops maclovinus]|uniref:Uncharacterized protein n=1 Tax=Eleginops maclovinus TaxID=56733 RepID=A0AAN8AKA7_ELEMC|nr:hypothetical protein PBY51_011252 [Eleginops maclovinus]